MTALTDRDREEAHAATLRALADLFASLPGLNEGLVYPLQELREALQPGTPARRTKAAAIVMSAVCQTTIRMQGR